ncbi:beta-ketoacyl synthase N-terminal-like domain-containing protein [Streptomyces sp. NPDC058682]|uniref:beta-ketoacyl synthase N-terminal-like domain-containing protein n=1 Tax=Streptomyces sp. NPDC058682 TaxID=3346596 RepID=UPI003665CE6A
MSDHNLEAAETDVAIIGMACSFAGAPDTDSFWHRICEGRELLTRFSEEDLAAAGIPRELLDDPRYIRVSSLIDEASGFDADFFGITPSEARLIDPQHRLLLELSWHALENAGYDPSRYPGDIGVFAGGGRHAYLRYIEPDFQASEHLDGSIRGLQADIGNYGDFLATRISYKLGLTGPALNVQTACSTALVAVHLACQSLFLGESDIALAGGVNIHTPQINGYIYEEGSICSPDGHLRPFDAEANGSVFGNGGGVVVLKRLTDALRQRDRVIAVIKGSAINNDGADKMSFTAPSISGQAEVIRRALQIAEIDPATIGFVETHGTGTAIGDPIEIAALVSAFDAGRSVTSARSCALGAVKAQIGHLGTSAGIAGLIKTALVLEHGMIPPVVNFTTLNPNIDLTGSPFYVPTEGRPFAGLRRAGVSAFGVGGTNAHALLEQAPTDLTSTASAGPAARHLPFVLSARSPEALTAMRRSHGAALRAEAAPLAADAAYVLATGRKRFRYRTFVTATTAQEAAALLASGTGQPTATAPDAELPVVFAFPGEGGQFVGLGQALYRGDTVYRSHVDECAFVLRDIAGYDIRELLFPDESGREEAEQKISQAPWAQPALFITEYSLARTMMAAGITPDIMIGHSLGEYAAACLAGVFGLRDALRMVSTRGRLMQHDTPDGAMMAVGLDEEELTALIPANLDLAGVNAVGQCVVSGSVAAIDRFQEQLQDTDIRHTRLATSNAAHSRLMDGIADEYRRLVEDIKMSSPKLCIVSTVTGQEVGPQEMSSSDYWLRHLRSPVRFKTAAITVLGNGPAVVLETGPGRALTRMFDNSGGNVPIAAVTPWLRDQAGASSTAEIIGDIWAHGGRIDWDRHFADLAPRRVPLPGYPFEHNEYWVELEDGALPDGLPELGSSARLTGWLQAPRWLAAPAPTTTVSSFTKRHVMLMSNSSSHTLSTAVATALTDAGHQVACVTTGADALSVPDGIDTVVHIATPRQAIPTFRLLDDVVAHDFWPLVETIGVLGGRRRAEGIDVLVVTADRYLVVPGDRVDPRAALLAGPCKVLPQEYPDVRLAELDLSSHALAADDLAGPAATVLAELDRLAHGTVLVYRDGLRHTAEYHALPSHTAPHPWRDGASYLITGGLGEIGLALAQDAARSARVRLALTQRSPWPDPSHWQRLSEDPATPDDTRRRLRTLLDIIRDGSEVTVLSADVSDEAAMRELRCQHGPFHGIVHAAGVPSGCLAGALDRAHASSVMAPKVRGALVLHEAVADEHTEWLALCSSMAAVVGGLGHTDYCSANAFLDAFAQWRDATGHRTVSLNFDAWTDGGMAVKEAERAKQAAPFDSYETWQPIEHPLFTSCATANDVTSYRGVMVQGSDWVLDEHHVAGSAIVPGTAVIEIIRAAAHHQLGHGGFALTELDLLRPLSGTHGRVEYTVRLAPETGSDGVCTVTMSGLGSDGEWYHQTVGRVEPCDLADAPPAEPLPHLTADDEPAAAPATSNLLAFGPRWDNLRRLRRLTDTDVLTECTLDKRFHHDLGRFTVHPALLDISAGAMVPLVSNRVHLPMSYERITVHGAMPAQVRSRITQRTVEDDSGVLVFDVTVQDEDGKPVLDIIGYALRAVDPEHVAAELDDSAHSADRPQNRRLVTTDAGDFTALRLVPATRRAPGPGEIGIEVRATGLNFKEVLIAAEMLNPPGPDHSFGLECAGIVTAVGADVSRIRVGDAVMGIGASCFSDYVTLRASLTCPIPSGMTYSQAASLPIAFTTAYDSLVNLAGLSCGERVLIHAAAGGVGLAAMQLAAHLGAEIWATAGNETKRDFVRNLGATLVMNSRTMDFEKTAVDAGGVDVVLNSLAGDCIPAGIRTLRPRGRFIEIGRRDILAGTPLDMSLFAEGRTFSAYNPEIDGGAFESAWHSVADLIRQGTITPLPVRTFTPEEVDEAFSFMSRAHHIGKVVVTRPEAQEPVTPAGSMDATTDVQGITTPVGVRAFLDALATELPQVLVSRRTVAMASDQLVVAKHILQESGSSRTHARPDLPYALVQPQTETEERLSELWSALLSIDHVGRSDRFLDLGGDSLYATQLVSRIRKAFGVRVAPAEILGDMDLAGLADIINRQIETAQENQ